MTIALMADDAKKELMVQFCIAYCRIFSEHRLVATGITGRMIREASGLPVETFLSGRQGGDQQLMSRIACNEIDMVLAFRDPLQKGNVNSAHTIMDLLRICDVHGIPVATNIATAEVLIHGLDRGDLAWRELARG